MARTVAYQGGKYRIEYACVNNGTSPGLDFFDGLSKIDQAKLSALFKMAGEGNFHNKESSATWEMDSLNSSRSK